MKTLLNIKALFIGILVPLCIYGFTISEKEQTCKGKFSHPNSEKNGNNEIDTLNIDCDSIYPKKGLFITLIRYENENEGYDNEKNSVFIFQKKVNGLKKEIFRDTIFSSFQKIEFVDYNNDKVKDVLVQNISDVRSNWTYNLYLINSKTSALIKVKGFEKIKAPRFNSVYNLVENYVMSGRNWTSFYKIIKNHIYDYNIVIYDEGNGNGVNKDYEKRYDEAIKRILKKK